LFPIFYLTNKTGNNLKCGIAHHCLLQDLYPVEPLGIEDARRVGDPTSIARPCKTIEDGRSLVLGNQWNMCIEDELRLEQKPTKDLRLAKKFLYETHLH